MIKVLMHKQPFFRTLGKALLLVFFLHTQLSALAEGDGGVDDLPKVAALTGSAPGSGTQPLNTGNSVSVSVDNIAGEILSERKIRNVISFRINEKTNRYMGLPFTVTAKVTIAYGNDANSLTSVDRDFTIEYKNDQNYNANQYFNFEGAKYVRITLREDLVVTPSDPVGNFDLRDVLIVENKMLVTRYFQLSSNAANLGPVSFTAGTVTADQLPVNWVWPEAAGENYTQLEWTWVEDELESYYYKNNALDFGLVFNNNSTRIDLPRGTTSYNIPLYYDGQGKLYYRIRAVNISKTGSRADGPWSTVRSLQFNGHDPFLNWQVRTSFAEEGKMKTVMEYFDGSLRSRQTLTKDNENNTVIAAESFYDGQGRPAIQVLPAPTMATVIKYQQSLNIFNGQAEGQDPAELFDFEVAGQTTNLHLTPYMEKTSGAAKYYSDANPEKDYGFNKYIPDAEGFPYTVTRYTPDATGRILFQSGVGAALKMGSKKETKYYYGSPAQEELDGLFGTEVGDKSHYFKNMVRDANGQMSVSYVDMHGRTIATALAGEAPQQLLPLPYGDNNIYPNQQQAYITRNLLDKNSNIVKGNSIESVGTLLVPFATSYQFSYQVTPATLQMDACPGAAAPTICFDCLYDLEISISDESGEKAPMIYKYSNVPVTPTTDCNAPAPTWEPALPSGANSLTVSLEEGSYIIRKTLTVSEASLARYRELFYQQNQCKTEQQLIDSVYNALLAVSDCGNMEPVTCESCNAAIGTFAEFRTKFLEGIGSPSPVTAEIEAEVTKAYNAAVLDCSRLCNTSSQTVSIRRQLMLADMMPDGGQYAKRTAVVPGSMYDTYDIFSTTNAATQPFYKKPKTSTGSGSGLYYDYSGQVDISIHPSPIDPNSLLDNLGEDEFAQMFTSSWADALLPYHPEFERLKFAENEMGAAYNWITDFANTEDYLTASTKNYILFTGNSTSTPYNDPLYIKVGTTEKQAMLSWVNGNYMQSNLSMWQIARGQLRCKSILDPFNQNSCFSEVAKTPPYADVTSDADKNLMWQYFRDMYVSAWTNQADKYIAQQRPLANEEMLIDQGYQLRFATNSQLAEQSDMDWYPSSPGGAPVLPPGGVPQAAANAYQSACGGYIASWKVTLEECPSIALHPNKDTIINRIVRGMEEVCKKGADANNPYGASSVAPGTPNDGSPRNFEEVIYAVFAQFGIAKTDLCNAYVIQSPKAYNQGQPFTQEYTTVIDTCNCNQLTAIKAAAAAANYNPAVLSSFNQYLQATYQDTLTPALFEAFSKCDSLYKPVTRNVCWISSYEGIDYDCDGEVPVCNGQQGAAMIIQGQGQSQLMSQQSIDTTYRTSNVNNEPPVGGTCTVFCPVYTCSTATVYTSVYYPLPEAQPLPSFLKCGYVPQNCLTCGALATLVQAFKDSLPDDYDDAPIYNAVLSEADIRHNELLAKFLNYRTGNNFTWEEYLGKAAAADCDLLNPAGGQNLPAILDVSERTSTTATLYLATQEINFLPGFTSLPNDYFEAYTTNGGSAGVNDVVICRSDTGITDIGGAFVPEEPCEKVYSMAVSIAEQIYNQRREFLLAEFEQRFKAHCLAAQESFSVRYQKKEYHYTLYYYDMAGNLVKTVPPKGVRPNFEEGYSAIIQTKRNNGDHESRPHEFVTQYRYNSLNQVTTQQTPDAGISQFWYDRLGRLAVSQNAQQQQDGKYSYTLYDDLGRITEVGQKPKSSPVMSQSISQVPLDLRDWIYNGDARQEMTVTRYDLAYGTEVQEDPQEIFAGRMGQRNLRNRVSYTYVKNSSSDELFYTGTFYTYDIHGNVDTLLQSYREVPAMSASKQKLIAYDYDLISGKVNAVDYQPDYYNSTTGWTYNPDKFFHRYQYDAENRLVTVETSRDKLFWEKDADYRYYKHGPLARTELGHLQVQGLDYAYTLQGWLKGVNSITVGGNYDMGNDGAEGSVVAQDVFGFGLHYYDNSTLQDYKPIVTSSIFNAFIRPGAAAEMQSLFNGNIAAMSVNLPALQKASPGTVNAEPLFYKYRYDQLNRIKRMDAFRGLASNQWSPVHLTNRDYEETIDYDPNGNILSYNRNGSPAISGKAERMDVLTYAYKPTTNQLDHVTDSVPSSAYTEDIDSQSSGNYTYDKIGNLTSDNGSSISWNVYGKIKRILKTDNTEILYTYDAAGNRITKTVTGVKTTVYVRDASGNVMSVYEQAAGSSNLEQAEIHLYGSSRLGLTGKLTVAVQDQSTVMGFPAWMRTFTRGEKIFELSNHLGNVLATVSDRKMAYCPDPDEGVACGTDGMGQPQLCPCSASPYAAFYKADVKSASDYAPFGMQMVGRGYSAGGYRYGFNGQEKSTEIDPNGNSMTAEFWQYDARLGRRWNIDPRPSVSISVYAAFANSPIYNSDPLGDTTVPNAPVGYASEGGNGGYNKIKELALSYQSSSRVFNIVDNVGDRFLMKESYSLVDGYNGKRWKTSRSYWSERPQAQGTEYSADAKWIPYMDEGESAKEQSKDVANILLAAPAVSGLAIFAAPHAVVTAGVSVGSRVINAGVDYTAQVAGNYMSGRSGADAWTNVNLSSIGVSLLNPGSSWGRLIFNNVTSSAFSVSATEGYNGIGGGKTFETALFQASVGTLAGRVTRGADVAMDRLGVRLARVQALYGTEGKLSNFLQSEIRNFQINATKLSIGFGGTGNAINNKLEE